MASPADDRVDQEAVIRVRLLPCWPTGSRQFVYQRLCLFQVGSVETFGEPVVNRYEKIAGFAAPALVAAESGEAHGGAQLPELGLLLPGDAQGFAIQALGGVGCPCRSSS